MANKLPTKIQFLLADAVRQEALGKLSLLGLYSGDVILLTGPLPKTLPEGQQALAIPSLAILATIMDGHGTFPTTGRLIDPNNKTFAAGPVQPVTKTNSGPFNYILPMVPFPVTAFGTYRFELTIKGKKYTYRFVVRHIDPKVKLPTKAAAPSTSKTKPKLPIKKTR